MRLGSSLRVPGVWKCLGLGEVGWEIAEATVGLHAGWADEDGVGTEGWLRRLEAAPVVEGGDLLWHLIKDVAELGRRVESLLGMRQRACCCARVFRC